LQVPEGKTVGDGISRLADAAEGAGSGINSLANTLVVKGAELVKALGEKAELAVGPATEMVSRLFGAYMEDARASIALMRMMVIKEFVLAGIGSLVVMLGGVGLGFMISFMEGFNSSWLPLVALLGLVLFFALALAISAFVEAFHTLDRMATMRSQLTSSVIDTLVTQFSTLRGKK
jgi:hypothetical protein